MEKINNYVHTKIKYNIRSFVKKRTCLSCVNFKHAWTSRRMPLVPRHGRPSREPAGQCTTVLSAWLKLFCIPLPIHKCMAHRYFLHFVQIWVLYKILFRLWVKSKGLQLAPSPSSPPPAQVSPAFQILSLTDWLIFRFFSKLLLRLF
jgi:hypothetical protein